VHLPAFRVWYVAAAFPTLSARGIGSEFAFTVDKTQHDARVGNVEATWTAGGRTRRRGSCAGRSFCVCGDGHGRINCTLCTPSGPDVETAQLLQHQLWRQLFPPAAHSTLTPSHCFATTAVSIALSLTIVYQTDCHTRSFLSRSRRIRSFPSALFAIPGVHVLVPYTAISHLGTERALRLATR
jgi:hypothetical protein